MRTRRKNEHKGKITFAPSFVGVKELVAEEALFLSQFPPSFLFLLTPTAHADAPALCGAPGFRAGSFSILESSPTKESEKRARRERLNVVVVCFSVFVFFFSNSFSLFSLVGSTSSIKTALPPLASSSPSPASGSDSDSSVDCSRSRSPPIESNDSESNSEQQRHGQCPSFRRR